MTSLRLGIVGGCVLLAGLAPPLRAAPAGGRDAAATAARIDELVAARWDAAKAKPAAPADDAEFVRRVYLDLAGRIPSVAEGRAFLEDKRPDKRRRLVDHLLAGPRYVTHFTHVWRSLLLPEAGTSFQTRFLVPGFENWLAMQLRRNAGYDQMVRELLTTPLGPQGMRGSVVPLGPTPGGPTPIAFYLAKENKAENLAAAASRLFLGVKLECAQCHNHPFAEWKREQFWGMAAFFAGIRGQRQGDFIGQPSEAADRREVTIPGTEKVVQASFLDGKKPDWKFRKGSRETLADWMTAADNPYFARAAVNRMWAYFFGTGLVDPVDEMVGGEHSTPSHPELLDELAREFAAHKFDMKFLIRAITSSRAYQLSSARTDKSQDDPRLFARMPLRGLSAEQLYDSLVQATGALAGGARGGQIAFGPGGPRDEFLTRFANGSDKPTEVQTSILQALSLMNGRMIQSATSIQNSETLAAVIDSPFLDTPGRIEALYLATMSRKPTARELSRLVRFVEDAGPDEKRYNEALADVFWALLNSGEFYLNH